MQNQDFRLPRTEPELGFGKPHSCHGVATHQGSEGSLFLLRQAIRPNHCHAAFGAFHMGAAHGLNLEGVLGVCHLCTEFPCH